MTITNTEPAGKGKVRISFDCGQDLVLYKGEMRRFGLQEQMEVSDSLYQQIYHEIVGKRVIRRAMHLLEKMDRTGWQLRRKLLEGGYPQELVDHAMDYVRSYHYIDDERYARTFIRLNQERRSILRMKMDLQARGVADEIIEQAMEEENETSQEMLIRRLLEKKQFHSATASFQEKQKIYQFLLRKGFRSSEIMHVMERV